MNKNPSLPTKYVCQSKHGSVIHHWAAFRIWFWDSTVCMHINCLKGEKTPLVCLSQSLRDKNSFIKGGIKDSIASKFSPAMNTTTRLSWGG